MKEALVSKGPTVKIVDSPIPEPNDDQVLIKVVVSGTNPKDWKIPEWLEGLNNTNSGDDIAGVVEKVGANVTEFKPGDRVAAFHEMTKPHGSFAEYAIAWAHTTFHLPKRTSFEEGAAIPLAAMTAAIGLYKSLRLPEPWVPADREIPLMIYGASSAVGAYAVQLARKSNIHPLICIAGASSDYVETLIDRSKGDTVVDYRGGEEAVIVGVKKALAGRELLHAYDAVSEKGSPGTLGKLLGKGATYTCVLRWDRPFEEIPTYVRQAGTNVGFVHRDDKDFGFVYFRYFTRGLQEGWFKAQPPEVVPGGLGGVQTALANLKEGKAHAVKYVLRIAETA